MPDPSNQTPNPEPNQEARAARADRLLKASLLGIAAGYLFKYGLAQLSSAAGFRMIGSLALAVSLFLGLIVFRGGPRWYPIVTVAIGMGLAELAALLD
jgi:hypothetical protein